MAGLRIPQEYQRSFAEIRGLDEEQVQEFVSALESESPTVNRADLHTRVASNVDTIARSDLDRLLDTLVSLYALREGMGLGIPDFAEAVCEAMDESGAEELRLDDEVERDLFKARLVQLLGINSLDTSAKANDLQYEHERTVHGPVRVLTDIRPIFGPDPENEPESAVIVHTLKISYHEGRQIKEFFLALDPEQVDELIGVLERASLKSESLKRMLAGTDVSYIDGE
ncbi:MAG: hypothetical protein H0U04_19895 [Rubrobacter sp.]|nr:hypothetical protein [Rubrobacter sp.]